MWGACRHHAILYKPLGPPWPLVSWVLQPVPNRYRERALCHALVGSFLKTAGNVSME